MPIELPDIMTPSADGELTAGWRVTTAPTYRPVTHAEVLAHLRASSAQFPESLCLTYIDAATDYVEEATNSVLTARTITAVFAQGDRIVVPRGPLISIASIGNGSDIADSYTLSHAGHRITVNPSRALSGTIRVTYRAGYAMPDGTEAAAAIPAGLRHAILMLVGTYYEARESTSDKPRTPVPHVDAYLQRLGRSLGVA